MRKVLSLLIIPVLLIGCAKVKEVEVFQEQEGLHEVVFHAGWDPETRTMLREDGSVWWEPGDEISLFVRSDQGGYKLTSTNTEPLAKVDFVGEIGDKAENASYIAVYPYDEETYCNDGVGEDDGISVMLPSVQVARENGLPENAFKSFAVSDNETLYFKNLFGGIKFSVSNPDIKRVTIKSIAQPYSGGIGDALSGRISYNIRGEMLSAVGPDQVTVIAPNDGFFSPDKFYYVVLPARELENGVVVTFKKEYSEASVFYEEGKTISKSTFKRLYKADEGLEFHDSHSTYARFTSSNIIPGSIERSSITGINFYTSSDKTTENVLYYTDPYAEAVYYEIDGAVLNYYTKGEVYQVTEGNGNSLFSGLSSITSLDLSHFDTSMCTDFGAMFSGCLALREIAFGDFNTGNARSMQSMFDDCISLETIDLSSFNTSNVENMYYMFRGCRTLKELDLSNFDTHNVTNMGDMFNSCYRLEKLDISSFSSDKIEYAPELFYMCLSLLKLNLGSFDLSKLDSNFNTCYKLASRSRNCAVLCTPETKEAMLSAEAKLGSCEPYIQWFTPGDILPDLSMNYDPDMYYSTDYSQDKKVTMLNAATEGSGVNVVIMGEAYSDRLIADGTYEADMTSAMEQIFSVEPFKSFRNLFNVYMVNAVSENEVVGEFTAFGYGHDSWFGNGGIDRDDVQINEYVSQAVGRSEDRKVTTLIVVNQDTGDGVSMMNASTSDSDHFDYPAKIEGVAFGSKSPDAERFKYVICHEFGHAFAALHDEYVTEVGEMETWESDYKKYYQEHLGWWANVSFTPDPNLVGWHQFLEEDSGYDETEVSVIEGALYSQGIWKSIDQSMMNAGGEFSVPAREAIYKKIHKVAFGEDWQYHFDDYVAWDRSAVPKPTTDPVSQAKVLVTNHTKHLFKIDESTTPEGKKKATFIMN